ncbi:MAG: glycosyltransferase family 2 protein [Runella slithyformis]|nr:MAG: glycosyltransferase family 2 protein [Runella slithyformis]TAF31900.1 MAG: glycosyltransferase family 2 protein [Cytophagales bacterium]
MNIDSYLISIIVPVYNCQYFLSATIESVIAQTYKNWELFIIDDCSLDNSFEIAISYQLKDERIKVLKNKSNSGQAFTRNQGLDVANGRFIAFLDSDDLWHPQKLEIHLKESLDKRLAFSYSDFELIDERSNSMKIRMIPSNNLSFQKFLKYNPVGCLTIFYDKEQANGLRFVEDKAYQSLEDNIFCAELFKQEIRYAKISIVLAYYRIRGNSSSARKITMLQKRVQMLRNYYKISAFGRIWYLGNYVFRNLIKYSRIKLLTLLK